MSNKLKICTFNIENLFIRFNFDAFSNEKDRNRLPPIVNFFTNSNYSDVTNFEEFKKLVQIANISQDDDKRQHTALAIAEADAQVYCFQEVDNFDALVRFWDFYVRKVDSRSFTNFILHEGNDRRGIDVAAVTRNIRPTYSRSHASMTASQIDDTASGRQLLAEFSKANSARSGRGRIFSRDCLELEVLVGQTRVSVFVCHFKSMSDGREKTIGLRQLESIAVREIIGRKFSDPSKENWIVCGDLNDYRTITKVLESNEVTKELDSSEPSGVDPLLYDGFGVNTLDSLDANDRWTHYYVNEKHKTQLDYIIASPKLARKVIGKPKIIRSGLPYRVPNTKDLERYHRIGWDRPKASDHCPVVVEFDIDDEIA